MMENMRNEMWKRRVWAFTWSLMLCMTTTSIANAQNTPISNHKFPVWESGLIKPKFDMYNASSGKTTRTFWVETPYDDINYCIAFWIIPSELSNNSYSTYKVSVNNSEEIELSFDEGNWQIAPLKTIVNMPKGRNEITVSCPAPEVPEVEYVCAIETLGRKVGPFSIDSLPNNYKHYLDESMNGKMIPPEVYGNVQGDGPEVYIDLPLKYSFYKRFYFKQGQNVTFTTSGKVGHVLDIFAVSDITNSNDSVPYSWQFVSEKFLNNINTGLTKTISIPHSGFYMARLRSYENGRQSTATLNVNGKYEYKKVPIYYSCVDISFPSDCNALAAAVMSNDTIADPMVFIEGGGAIPGKVVGFNDDCWSYYLADYTLKEWDSYHWNSYAVKPTSVSYSNYSSSSPTSTCTLVIAHDNSVTAKGTDALSLAQWEGTDGNGDPKAPDFDIAPIQDRKANVEVFDMNGMMILRTTQWNSKNFKELMREAGIGAGTYILRFTTEDGTNVRKINLGK